MGRPCRDNCNKGIKHSRLNTKFWPHLRLRSLCFRLNSKSLKSSCIIFVLNCPFSTNCGCLDNEKRIFNYPIKLYCLFYLWFSRGMFIKLSYLYSLCLSRSMLGAECTSSRKKGIPLLRSSTQVNSMTNMRFMTIMNVCDKFENYDNLNWYWQLYGSFDIYDIYYLHFFFNILYFIGLCLYGLG